MPDVYVVTSAFDYEGEKPIGLYSSLHWAQVAARNAAEQSGCDGGQWVQKSERMWELSFGATQFIVRQEFVRDHV